ncbi:hypothetical protein [Terricaulis sp.]|uniref:hypothetical protein n=1 Tax=Terricaulis sp. TaxID=2768686 RepID=UPI00378515BD
MRLILCALAGLTALVAFDALAQTPMQHDTAAALVRPLPVTIDNSERTVMPRQPIFAQEVAVMEAARLTRPVRATFPLGRVQADMSLPADAELFRVAFSSTPELHAFCALETTQTDVGPQRPARVGRTCLSDDDNDGSFDRLWYMVVPVGAGGNGDGTWQIYPFTRIAGGLVYSVRDERLRSPAPYVVTPTHSIAPMTLEIVYVTWGRGIAFQLKAREGDALTDIGTEVTGAVSVDAGIEFPKRLSFMGAEIDILARADDAAIIYRVRRGFPDDAPLRLENTPPPAPPPPAARN